MYYVASYNIFLNFELTLIFVVKNDSNYSHFPMNKLKCFNNGFDYFSDLDLEEKMVDNYSKLEDFT